MSVTDIPGVSIAAQIGLLVYVVAPLAWVCALARLIHELTSALRQRFAAEHALVSVLSLAMLPGLALALYFYVLAIANLASESFPEEVPDLSSGAALAFIAMTDAAVGLAQDIPLCLSWLTAAALGHGFAELLHYVVGIPRRRRDRALFDNAVEAFGTKDPAAPATQRGAANRKLP